MESYLTLNTLYGKRTNLNRVQSIQTLQWVFDDIVLPLPKGDVYMTATRITCEESGLMYCIECGFEYSHRHVGTWEKPARFNLYVTSIEQLVKELNEFFTENLPGESPNLILPPPLDTHQSNRDKLILKTGDYTLRNFTPAMDKVLGLGCNALEYHNLNYGYGLTFAGIRKAKMPSVLDCYLAMDILESSTYMPTVGLQPVLLPMMLSPTGSSPTKIEDRIIETLIIVPRYVKLQQKCAVNRITLSLRYGCNGELVRTKSKHQLDLIVECLYKARLQLAF